jgi:phosphoglycerate dehydrogenase-like enzyme
MSSVTCQTRDAAHADKRECSPRGADGAAKQTGDEPPSLQVVGCNLLHRVPHRKVHQRDDELKHGVWQQSGLKAASMPPNFGVGMLLKGKTLGIWGYGKIGRLVAGYGRAFGMDVVVWGSELSRERAVADGCTAAPSCEHFFDTADVLSLHLRLTDQTRGIVRLDALSRMKPTALLVNTSRAELMEDNALVAALNRGSRDVVGSVSVQA